jgi:hypothetical protein
MAALRTLAIVFITLAVLGYATFITVALLRLVSSTS